MQTTLFETVLPQERSGFRLQRFEVYNWGTFHQRVWRLGCEGANSLLTGDIGSGKSTLVDAITTLLVPHHRITYNKAAGAEAKERTLASYIRGEYKSEKDQENQIAKAVALREKNTYTVVLGHFFNEGFEQGVTLAQVFWLKDQNRQVERFFVISESPLSIAEHFSDFGSDIFDLKRKLKRLPQTHIHETFKDYGSRFRTLFGIAHEQALDLFYQTISLKTVGNLTDFVRTHMLEPFEVGPRIDELRRNFDNLSRAHASVVRARRQIELLTPISEAGQRHEEIERSVQRLVHARDSLASYFAKIKADLLETRIDERRGEIEKLETRLTKASEEISYWANQEIEIRDSIRENGGGRLEAIQREEERLSAELPQYQARAASYEKTAEALGLPKAADEEAFFQNRRETESLMETIDLELVKCRTEEVEATLEFRAQKDKHAEVEEELRSLRARRSNIPARNLEIRRAMAEAIGVAENELPFAGELIRVREGEEAWEGAAERLLRGFALSLLVSDGLYAQVSQYVDRTFLKGKIVYFRTRAAGKATTAKGASSSAMRAMEDLEERSLVRKLTLKPDSVHREWLERHLADRFDYLCCESLEDFRLVPFAITRAGQIKAGGQRHEKDDRTSLQDRSQYVLGWENALKIKALEEKRNTIAELAARAAQALETAKARHSASTVKRDGCRALLAHSDFTLIDWRPLASRLQLLKDEREKLEATSDRLRVLRQALDEAIMAKDKLTTRREEWLQKKGEAQSEIKQAEETRQLALEIHDARGPQERERDFPEIDRFRATLEAGVKPPRLHEVDRTQTTTREAVQTEIDKERKKGEYMHQKLRDGMFAFKQEFPVETSEFDASLESLGEFNRLLRALQDEDLPRHEERFRKLLNEGAINGIALFRNQLEKEAREIEGKITAINRSLREIEYNAGTYIELVCDRAMDAETRQFQSDLKACTEHGISDGDSAYDEMKFMRVKQILDRFNGRENFTELDRRWTTKVTDVRNWYTFSASERFDETGEEKEYYSDSSGKSGGQKEKLAYTVLASALAYQFGLEWNAKKSRTFRFVVIDEAFGRGSDESARYGLELFRKLNLQLLVVTPLQKIHVIEDYVNSVHFVHNDGGRDSKIRSLSITEYKQEKARRATAGSA